MRLPPKRLAPDAAQYERDTGRVEWRRPLAQEQPCQRDAENRHQVDEESRDIGADGLDPAIPERVREHGREQCDCDQRPRARPRPMHVAAQRHFAQP
jgi:hypothetical protein